MRVVALPICLLLVLVGGVFLGQGVGLIPGSFMTGSATWAVIGGVMIAAGAGILVVAARRPGP
jgi:F0F1-type ATP synthase assembly protein I